MTIILNKPAFFSVNMLDIISNKHYGDIFRIYHYSKIVCSMHHDNRVRYCILPQLPTRIETVTNGDEK